jgi:hypothetical protein
MAGLNGGLISIVLGGKEDCFALADYGFHLEAVVDRKC